MRIAFTKAVASGNDFIILDNRENRLSNEGVNFSKFAEFSCARKFSVGADGLLVLEDSDEADFRMRVFNPDGGEVEMCGNGMRAAALYANVNKWGESPVRVETKAGILVTEVKEGSVKIRMTEPKDLRLNRNVGIGDTIVNLHSVNTGVPHAIHFVENISEYAVKQIGSEIRYHKMFEPDGTNADFVEVVDDSTIRVRTYERGVEDETLACGTGVVASAIISSLTDDTKQPVSVITKSGESLKVYFRKGHDVFTDVFLEGKAGIVFEGELDVF